MLFGCSHWMMKSVYIAFALGVAFLALVYQPKWISTVVIVGFVLTVAVGLVVFITAHVSLVTRSNSSLVYSKPDLEAMRRYLNVSNRLISIFQSFSCIKINPIIK